MKAGFLLSVMLHALLVGACLSIASFTTVPQSVLVLLTDCGPDGGGGGGSNSTAVTPHRTSSPSASKPPALKHRPTRVRPQSTPRSAAASIDNHDTTYAVAPPAPQLPDTDLPPATSVSANDIALTGGTGHGSGTGTGVGPGSGSGSGTGMGSGIGGGTGAAIGAGTGRGESAESLRRRYLKEHFAYIRDLIVRNLSYPSMARKLGWCGGVTVSFVVRIDGRAEKIRVLKNSGYDILDQNVVQTIKQVEPFPKPPVKAELTIPVVYRLE